MNENTIKSDILRKHVTMSFNLNTHTDLTKQNVIIQVCQLSTILRYHAC
jgi:hypothetical protein